MSELLSYSLDQGVATISLHNGKVNAFSPALIAELNDALDQADKDQAVVMLVGKPGIFSAGFDLTVMQATDNQARADLVMAGMDLSRRLLEFPHPVVAVCTGHAVAMGLIALLACDYRIGAEGNFTLGLNEVQIGMALPQTANELVLARIQPSYIQRVALNAELLTPSQAVVAGVLDKAVAADELLDQALTEARRLAGLDRRAFSQTKRNLRRYLLQSLTSVHEEDCQTLASGGPL